VVTTHAITYECESHEQRLRLGDMRHRELSIGVSRDRVMGQMAYAFVHDIVSRDALTPREATTSR
jgi:hypothetical protein